MRINEISQIHPAYRNGDERLCEIANKSGMYQQRDKIKYTLTITNKSGVNPEPREEPTFDLLASGTYKGKISDATRREQAH